MVRGVARLYSDQRGQCHLSGQLEAMGRGTGTGCLQKGLRNGKNGCVTVKLIIHPYII